MRLDSIGSKGSGLFDDLFSAVSKIGHVLTWAPGAALGLLAAPYIAETWSPPVHDSDVLAVGFTSGLVVVGALIFHLLCQAVRFAYGLLRSLVSYLWSRHLARRLVGLRLRWLSDEEKAFLCRMLHHSYSGAFRDEVLPRDEELLRHLIDWRLVVPPAHNDTFSAPGNLSPGAWAAVRHDATVIGMCWAWMPVPGEERYVEPSLFRGDGAEAIEEAREFTGEDAVVTRDIHGRHALMSHSPSRDVTRNRASGT